MAQKKSNRNAWWLALGILLLCVPLILSLTWGAYFRDAAYVPLQAAQSLANGFALPTLVYYGGTVAQAPLSVGLLALAGTYAPQIALVAGALGWSATALIALLAFRAAGRPLAAVIAALLLVFNPLVLATAGMEISWVLALGWAAVALTVLPLGLSKGGVWLKVILLVLLLSLHFNAATILLALTLTAIDVYKERAGWLPFSLFAAAALLWGLFMIYQFGSAGSPPTADLLLWLREGYALLANQQLCWLYLPFVLVGLWDLWTSDRPEGNSQQVLVNRKQPAAYGQHLIDREGMTDLQQLFLLLFLWATAAVLAGDLFAPYIVAVVVIALAALGAAWLARRLLAREQLTADDRRAVPLAPLLLAAPLLIVSAVYLWQLYGARPVLRAGLHDQAAAWLTENAGPEAVLYAPPRAGYMAGLRGMPAMLRQVRDANVDEVYAELFELTPDYIVSENSFSWDYITRTTWFRDRYQERARFADGYALDSPVTVWEYAPSPYDDGEAERLTAVVDDRFALVGYQFEPQVIAPGDDVYLTLYLEALQPVEHGFITGVHLSAPDGWVWAWREERTPRALSGQWWTPGQVIPERIRLQTTEDIPLGAYDLQVFWRAGDDKSNWPIVRDGDDNVLDRIFLGSVVAPSPVNIEQATPTNAQFDHGMGAILLDAFQLSEAPTPGESLDVTLFWEALDAPAADYTVFVHLLDGSGQVVAAHDSMPGDNSFPTGSWKPGLRISDTHRLDLPPDLAPGTYQVNVGLYLLETGERLPVMDAAGVELPDRTLTLTAVEID